MNLDTWASFATIGSFVVPILGGGILWLAKVSRTMKLVEQRSRQLENNGGSHMRDAIDRLEKRQGEFMAASAVDSASLRHAVKNLNTAFLSHLEAHDFSDLIRSTED